MSKWITVSKIVYNKKKHYFVAHFSDGRHINMPRVDKATEKQLFAKEYNGEDLKNEMPPVTIIQLEAQVNRLSGNKPN